MKRILAISEILEYNSLNMDFYFIFFHSQLCDTGRDDIWQREMDFFGGEGMPGHHIVKAVCRIVKTYDVIAGIDGCLHIVL